MTHRNSVYPFAPHPGKTDTSAAALIAVSRNHRSIQIKVGDAVRSASDGLTNEEVAERLGLSVYAVRARMSELRAMAHVRDSGDRRFNAQGRKVIVWTWVSPGEERHRLRASFEPANDREVRCPTCGQTVLGNVSETSQDRHGDGRQSDGRRSDRSDGDAGGAE